MQRKVRLPWWFVVLGLVLLVPPVVAKPAGSQRPGKPPAPSPRTVIRQAPPGLCQLLDIPARRQMMDGLLFNLLWSCGRQHELGGVESGAEDLNLTLALGAGDIQVNNSTGEVGDNTTQSETSIAYNPVTGVLCSAFNDSWEFYSGGGGFNGFARSTNRGSTWQDRGAVGGAAMGDPSLVWRRADGNFYLATLESGGGLRIWVSTDNCQTFTYRQTPSTGGDDKEILAVDNNPTSPHYGNLYLVWTDFGVAGSPIRTSRSTDGGFNWSAPLTISPANQGEVQGAWPAVAPNGDVFVSWLRTLNNQVSIDVTRSTNGGGAYTQVTSPLVNAVSPRNAAATANCFPYNALNGNIRYFAFPQLAIDHNNALHVVYSYDPDGFNVGDVVNVYYRRSTNSGASWGAEVRLNDDATTRDQFSPTIQVSGSTVTTSWYDRRLDPNNLLLDYYRRTSTDGGTTWTASERITDVSSPVRLDPGTATCYHGDYDQSLAEVVHWSDDRNVLSGHNDGDVWSDALFTAPSYEGYLDVVNCRSIAGWAWDRIRPNTPINVDIRDGSTLLATVAANQYRQDLFNAGKGNGYHGFGHTPPGSVKNGQWHSISARYAGTSTDVASSPRNLICAVSVFTTQTPAEYNSTGGTSYDVGNQISSSVNGYITHLRYWKAPGETGSHTLRLWSDTGTPLASVPLLSESASGWQTGQLATPVAITANVRYRVSVTTYTVQSKTSCGLSTPITNGPLTAHQGFWIAGNGAFPTTSSCSNFWTDVIFDM